jgi:hypothetical protein
MFPKSAIGYNEAPISMASLGTKSFKPHVDAGHFKIFAVLLGLIFDLSLHARFEL